MNLRRVLFNLVGSLAGLCLLGVVALVVGLVAELSYTPVYDRADPNYHRYLEAFQRVRVPLNERGLTKEDYIDLSQLNDGDWKTACLFGGYTRPLDEMLALGATISEKDQIRLTEAGTRRFRIGQVDEFEIMIAFVDLSNNARFIHFHNGIGPAGQHFQKCISKPETTLVLGERAL